MTDRTVHGIVLSRHISPDERIATYSCYSLYAFVVVSYLNVYGERVGAWYNYCVYPQK